MKNVNNRLLHEKRLLHATTTRKLCFLHCQMPENKPTSAMTSFMAQCSELGKWLPMNLKYAGIKNFCKMLNTPEVNWKKCSV